VKRIVNEVRQFVLKVVLGVDLNTITVLPNLAVVVTVLRLNNVNGVAGLFQILVENAE
jgi:hypothetical protein